MFIELTSNHEKYLINTDHIMMITKSDWVDDLEQSMLTFSHPLTLRGSNKLAVKETYKEIMDMISNK